MKTVSWQVAARISGSTLLASTQVAYTCSRHTLVNKGKITFELSSELDAYEVSAVPIAPDEPLEYWNVNVNTE